MISEEALVSRVVAGDVAAEEEFYRLFQPPMLRAVLYFMGGRDSDAEDIVQEAFLVALPKLKDFVFRGAPLFAWLRQICLRLCYARLRTRKRMLMSVEEDLEMFMQRAAVERLQLEALELKKGQKLALLAALKLKLSADSAQVIQLRNVEGLSYAQISTALGLPMGTVMSRLSRARDQLRKLLEDERSVYLQPPVLSAV